MTFFIFSGTSSIVSPATSRSHGDEGGHCWETGGHSVPQNLHSAIRKRQVKRRVATSGLSVRFTHCFAFYEQNFIEY
jgi:hypothetical protein